MNINNYITQWARLINESQGIRESVLLEWEQKYDITEWFDENGNETETFKNEAGLKEEWKSIKNGHMIKSFIIPFYSYGKWSILKINYDTVTKKDFKPVPYRYGNKKFKTREEAVEYIKDIDRQFRSRMTNESKFDDEKFRNFNLVKWSEVYDPDELTEKELNMSNKKFMEYVLQEIYNFYSKNGGMYRRCEVLDYSFEQFDRDDDLAEWICDTFPEDTEIVTLDDILTDEYKKYWLNIVDKVVENYWEEHSDEFDDDGNYSGDLRDYDDQYDESEDTGLHKPNRTFDYLYKAIEEDPIYVANMLALAVDREKADLILGVIKSRKVDTNAKRYLYKYLRSSISQGEEYDREMQSNLHRHRPDLFDNPDRIGYGSDSKPHKKHKINGPQGDLPK